MSDTTDMGRYKALAAVSGAVGDIKKQLAYLVLEQNEMHDYGGPSTEMISLAASIVGEQDVLAGGQLVHPGLVAELVHESYSTWLSALLEARNEQDREVCARRLRTMTGGDATTEQLMTIARWVAAQMSSDA